MKYYLREAKIFLDLNWHEHLYDTSTSRHERAEMLGLTYLPSLEMCKRNFGMTFVQFFVHCKLAEIKQFLVKSESLELTLQEIAQKFGYASRRNLHHEFKKVEDMTPGEFRYFHEHFVETTGQTLVEYDQPDLERYLPENEQPTFLSNFLNRQMEKVLSNEQHIA